MAACASSGRGYVHVYTGNGKGKTTAAMGLAVRALGRGRRVFIGQFMKSAPSGETLLLKSLPGVEYRLFGSPRCVGYRIQEADRKAAAAGVEACAEALRSGRFDMAVFDELCVAVSRGAVPLDDALSLISLRPASCELVITGRNADPALVEAADLVTEMREVRHYLAAGVAAREGVEY